MNRSLTSNLLLFFLLIIINISLTNTQINNSTNLSDFSYVTHIGFSFNDDKFCLGSLITEYHVITTASCLHYDWGGLIPHFILSIFSNSEIYNATNIFIHPNYKFGYDENNLGIVKINHKAKRKIKVLPSINNVLFKSNCSTLFSIKEGNSTDFVLHMNETVLNNCKSDYFDDICCVNKYILPPCQIIHGSPLLCDGSLIGIAHAKNNCNDTSQPNIYTDVSSNYNWIHNTTSSSIIQTSSIILIFYSIVIPNYLF